MKFFTIIIIFITFGVYAAPPTTKVKITKIYDKIFSKNLTIPAECKSVISRDYVATAPGIVDYAYNQHTKIKKGELLFAIDMSLSESQKELADSDYKAASLSFQRDKQLFIKKIISEEKLEQSKVKYYAAKSQYEESIKQLDNKLIFAPFDGEVSIAQFKKGDIVSSGDFLLNIVSGDKKIINFIVPEQYVIDENASVTITYNDLSYVTKNFKISKNLLIDKTGYSGVAYIDDANLLEHNSFVKLSISYDIKNGKALPESAIMIDNGRHYVYAIDKDSKAQKLFINLGERSKADREIISDNITLDTQIVIEGIQKLRDGQNVEIIN